MGCAWQLVLLSSLCLLVENDAIRVADILDAGVAESEGDQEVGQALVPFDYWNMTNSWDRCLAARRGRTVRRVAGAVVGVVIALPVALIGALAYSALYWTWYLEGAKSTVLYVSTHAAALAGAWATLMTTRGGSSVSHWTSDMIAYLTGKDGHKPICCCADPAETNETTKMCGTVGSAIGRRAKCPAGFLHEPDSCESYEPMSFGVETHSGCECKDHGRCDKNKYDRGHAWCTVKTSKGCSPKRFKSNPFKHWDYCKIVASEVLVPGAPSITVNTFVSQFTINEDKAWYRGKATNVWRFGSYADVSKALVIAPVTLDGEKSSRCFPGEPEETLDGCAQNCLEEGAPISTSDGEDLRIPCVAFAYNRHTRLCVRLPSAATGAEFRPWQRNPELRGGHSDGWQNFKLIPKEA